MAKFSYLPISFLKVVFVLGILSGLVYDSKLTSISTYIPTIPFNYFTNVWFTPATSTSTSTSVNEPGSKSSNLYSPTLWFTIRSSSKTTRTSPANVITDATLLYHILARETSLRMEQERTIIEMMKEFEQMKKNYAESKMEQDTLIEQLMNNVTSLNTENKMLKDDLSFLKRQALNNSAGSAHCQCNVSNMIKELQNVKREVRYISLSFLDLQRESSMNTDRVDEEILNLTTRFFSLETQMTVFDTSVRHVEQFLPKVRNFMNDTRDLQQILLRIQHEQFKISAELLDLANNTVISKKVAFSATNPQGFTSKSGQTVVFPHILSNVGDGYNNQDGVFTAPVDGVYVFFCKITQGINNSDFFYQFILNGSVKTVTLVYGRSDDTYRTSSNLIVLQLSRGDRIWIKMQQGGSHWGNTDGGDQSFSGFMV